MTREVYNEMLSDDRSDRWSQDIQQDALTRVVSLHEQEYPETKGYFTTCYSSIAQYDSTTGRAFFEIDLEGWNDEITPKDATRHLFDCIKDLDQIVSRTSTND